MDFVAAHKTIRIAIVGCGPRGTYGFAALARRLAALGGSVRAEIFLIDPYINQGGEVYNTTQPSYFLMNTVAEQITTRPDHTVTASAAIEQPDSMAEWFTSNISESLKPNSYLPRRYHGEYLMQARTAAATLLPASATVESLDSEVVGVKESNGLFSLRLANGKFLQGISSLLITTGRGTPDSLTGAENSPDIVENPYPIDRWIADISPEHTIGVQGLGLTAVDVVLALTIGRGGAFDDNHGRVIYHPSGREPKIVAWSRSGIPLLARAANQKGADGRHVAQFLTYDVVNELRRRSIAEGMEGKLDFHGQVLPLISKEIRLAACLSYFYKKLPDATIDGVEIIDRLFHKLPLELQLDWEKLEKASMISVGNHEEYATGMRNFLESDLEAASQGNVLNVRKCAADCLRDIRDQIRAAVDWCGLTPASMERFEKEFVPPYLRLAVGPPPMRIKQFLALNDAGVLDLGLGPNPELLVDGGGRHIVRSRLSGGPSFGLDKLIKARITSVPGGHMANALLQSGLCRLAENRLGDQSHRIPALDVNVANQAIDPQGRPVTGLFIFGALCEGINWYTFAAARPFVGSRVLCDAEKWADTEMSRLLSGLGHEADKFERGPYANTHFAPDNPSGYPVPYYPGANGRGDYDSGAGHLGL